VRTGAFSYDPKPSCDTVNDPRGRKWGCSSAPPDQIDCFYQHTCTIYRDGARHPRHLNARVSALLLLKLSSPVHCTTALALPGVAGELPGHFGGLSGIKSELLVAPCSRGEGR
jgi:hypothetical protein